MTTRSVAVSPDPALVDQRVVLHGVPWEQYESLLASRGDDGSLRVTYVRGELEIMTPSTVHEIMKKRLARLIEAYAEKADIPLEGYGSWTVKNREKELGAEADECYVVGARDPEDVEAPDIAIEIVWTSGGLPKLAVWRQLGAQEVWFWQDGELRFFVLRGDEYESAPRSELVPGLDPASIARFMASDEDQTTAVRRFRQAIRDS